MLNHQQVEQLFTWFHAEHGTLTNLRPIARTSSVTLEEIFLLLNMSQTSQAIESVLIKNFSEFNVATVYKEELREFFNDQPIKISTDITRLNALKNFLENEAVASDEWLDWLKLNQPYLPELLSTLYLLTRINNNQIVDLLNHWQIVTGDDFKILTYFYILDNNDNFTKEAVLLDQLWQEKQAWPPLTPEIKEEFRMLLAQSKDRPFIFISEIGRYERCPKNDLADAVMKAMNVPSRIEYKGKKALLHLGISACEALNLAFRKTQCGKFKIIMNMASKEQIESGVKKHERVGTICNDSNDVTIAHNADRMTTLWGKYTHDLFHSQILCYLPRSFIDATNRVADVLRATFTAKWSKEIWFLVEKDFGWFLTNIAKYNFLELNEKTVELNTQYFCQALINARVLYLFFLPCDDKLTEFMPTPSGFFMLMDMLENEEIWKKIGITPEHFIDPLRHAYKCLKEIYPSIKGQDTKLQYVKYVIFCRTGAVEYCKAYFDAIEEHHEAIIKLLAWKKQPASKGYYEKNSFNLQYGNKNFKWDKFCLNLLQKNELTVIKKGAATTIFYPFFEPKNHLKEDTSDEQLGSSLRKLGNLSP